MLVNLTPKNRFHSMIERHAKYLNRSWRDIGEKKYTAWRFTDIFAPTMYIGVFWCDDKNLVDSWCKQHIVYHSEAFRDKLSDIPKDNIRDYVNMDMNAWTYGVADNLEQIVQLYEENRDGYFRGNHVILCHKVIKNPDAPCSGWRWRKWGEYIGIHTPKCEYLNDEPVIKEVICFSILQVI